VRVVEMPEGRLMRQPPGGLPACELLTDLTPFNRLLTRYNRLFTPVLNRNALVSAIFRLVLTDSTKFVGVGGLNGVDGFLAYLETDYRNRGIGVNNASLIPMVSSWHYSRSNEASSPLSRILGI
jgi:hypothetical protein